jgi:hypothetical protein
VETELKIRPATEGEKFTSIGNTRRVSLTSRHVHHALECLQLPGFWNHDDSDSMSALPHIAAAPSPYKPQSRYHHTVAVAGGNASRLITTPLPWELHEMWLPVFVADFSVFPLTPPLILAKRPDRRSFSCSTDQNKRMRGAQGNAQNLKSP